MATVANLQVVREYIPTHFCKLLVRADPKTQTKIKIFEPRLRPKEQNQTRARCAYVRTRRLEQDAPVYVHELFLLIWPQLKIASWPIGKRAKIGYWFVKSFYRFVKCQNILNGS